MFCTQCGAKSPDNAKFCHKCGAALPLSSTLAAAPVEAVPPAPQVEPVHSTPVAEPTSAPPVPPFRPAVVETETTTPPYIDQAEPETVRPWWKAPAAMIAAGTALLAFMAWGTRDFWLGMDPVTASNAVVSSGSGSAPVDDATTQSFFVSRTAKLRDKPTTTGSIIKGEAPRGTALQGSLVIGEDGKTQWLKVASTGEYISFANLSTSAPLPLSIALNRTLTLDEVSAVRSGPADDAAPIDSLQAGAKVEAIGVVNGWIEIGLKKGGVGYFKPSATSANFGALVGKATIKEAAYDFGSAISMTAGNCGFGPSLDRVFTAMRNYAGKGPFSVEGIPGTLTAKPTGPADSEEAIGASVMAAKGKFKGLNLVALFTGYEGQGVHFSDSVETVGKALASYGYTPSEDGKSYSDSGDGAGGFIERQGNVTVLYCGS
jgi:hypothetical protein